jgi:hypothetical protein
MSRDELRFRRLKFWLQLNELLSWQSCREVWEAWRAVIRSTKGATTYASELRLHLLATLIGVFLFVPNAQVGSLHIYTVVIPQVVWATGCLGVGLYGLAQMIRTRGNIRANERGRTRALRLQIFTFAFLGVLQICAAPTRLATVMFPYIMLVAAEMSIRLAKHGPNPTPRKEGAP